MRVVIESERTLVVESQGQIAKLLFLLVVLPLVVIHAVFFYPEFRLLAARAHPAMAYLLLAVSVAVYAGLACLVLGPMRDRVTITFHGVKNYVSLERALPFGFQTRRTISFQDFDRFEISPPEAKGFCRLRMKDGKALMLFRVGRRDDFAAVQRLEMITRKKVETIR